MVTPEKFLDRFFPASWNPLYNLGALSFYLFWIVAITGLYLFIFFDTSIQGAYLSVQSITYEQYFIGSLIRSLHRYASAAMAVTVTLHLVKELLMKRYQGPRWFSWVSGVPLLWLLFASAIGGYWLVWDERAQYVAIVTAALFDYLPIVVEPMAFGFVDNASVGDRFFTLLIFLHVGVPLFLLLGMFIHIQRISDSNTFPERGLAIGVLLSLIALSIVNPAISLGPADFDKPIATMQIDWFYMNFYPLVEYLGPGMVWLLLLGVTVVLLLVPVISREKVTVIAEVDPDYCNGCGWCFADCPYDAITMKPHDFKANHQQSVVIADKCVGCGICAGACPTATPFKSVNKSFSGINLVDKSNSEILVQTQSQVQQLEPEKRILVVGCAHGSKLEQLRSESVATETLECIAQLPPSYIDFLCRRESVDAVLLTGCSSGNCFHRLGVELQEARLAHDREPHLRFKDVKVRVNTFWVGAGGEAELAEKVRQMQFNLANDHVQSS
jgi:quinol-cytochrome oxidoreductase complex cytochrome b subunit/coenzyme F420-reducing hydrogenase delta subunit